MTIRPDFKCILYGSIVQRLERLTVYQDVAGSNPAGVAKDRSHVGFVETL